MIRGAFEKFLALSLTSATDLQARLHLFDTNIITQCTQKNMVGTIRGAFGKFLALSLISVTDLQARLHLFDTYIIKQCNQKNMVGTVDAEQSTVGFARTKVVPSIPDGGLTFVDVTRDIYKKGDKSAAANYRPISLTNILCNLLQDFSKECVMKIYFSYFSTKT